MAKSLGVDEVLKLIFIPSDELSDIDLSSGDELDQPRSSDPSDDGLDYEVEHDATSDNEHTDTSSDEDSGNATPSTSKSAGTSKTKLSVYKWKKVLPEFRATDFTGGDFQDPPMDLPTPMEYFKMFINQECIQYIADQTNLFAMQKDGKEIKASTDEIEQFIGILLMIGLFPCPSYRMYWSNDSRFSSVADVMSRNRFECLLRYVQFNDNSNVRGREDPDYDPLFKNRPLLDMLRVEMGKFEPEECQSIDEQIFAFKGRSSLKQYNKNKPHKWGFKVFTRAGSPGIMYDFEVYTGKSMKLEGNLTISGNVVLRLVRNLPRDRNFKV
ncbi:piggyBac transposable element-derived protein 5-like [Liolophura sinensis]|uniref:piggyBac transposable element-derived protein 5-like n=1 Tax=Liolophura sinensis TaxID=3198878 RepID=UPI003158A1FB